MRVLYLVQVTNLLMGEMVKLADHRNSYDVFWILDQQFPIAWKRFCILYGSVPDQVSVKTEKLRLVLSDQ